jgi:ABC-2 type transport system ATP-binding protein
LEKKDVLAGNFSKGMKRKPAIARVPIHGPEPLFMDEPTANLDPESAKTVREFIVDLKKEKKTIFLNTHNLDETQRICDRIVILDTKSMAMGTPEELERSIRGRRTMIHVRQMSEAILDPLQGLRLRNMVAEGNRVTADIEDPESENPEMVNAIVKAGGLVVTVSVLGSTIEDAYLTLVRETKAQ